MTDLEDVDPEDEPRAFWRQPAPQRTVVLAAGSTMHFLLAFVLFAVALIAVGVRTGGSTTTVDVVSACLPQTVDDVCTASSAPSPAKAAGLQVGDTVVSYDGRPVDDWTEFTARVRASAPGPRPLVVERDGSRVELTVSASAVQRPDLDDPTRTVTVGALGLAPRQAVERYGLITGLGRSVDAMGQTFAGTGKALVALPASIPRLVDATFGDGERDAEGAVSLLGAGKIAGETARDGLFAEFLVLIASINVFIGVFNLLPLLPLDGGHIAVLGFEQARSRLARLFGRPDPGRVDLRKLLPTAYGFIVFLVALQVLVLYADIANPIANPFGG